MKVFLLILSLFTVSFSASYVHAGNCDTHSTDKKRKRLWDIILNIILRNSKKKAVLAISRTAFLVC